MASDKSHFETMVDDDRAKLDWARLSQLIRSGDGESFATYYQNFFDLMFQEARRATGADESTCLDIVQDGMIKAIKGMRPVRDENHLIAWTRVVARNSAYDWLRKQSRRMERSLSEPSLGLVADQSDGESRVDSKNAIDIQARILWVEQQLKKIDPELKEMVAMRYRLGWTLKDVAEKFGLKTGAVDGRIRRAMERIRQQAELEFNE